MIKVALITRSTLYTAAGGDTVQAVETARLLAEHGFTAEVRLAHEAINYNEYRLLHFFNITRPADILRHIRKSTLPFVLSTIHIDYSEYDKFHRKGLPGILFRCLSADAIEYLKAVSRGVRGTDRMPSMTYLWKGQKKSICDIIKKASLLLPNSSSEYRRLSASYCCHNDYLVVPNAINSQLFRFDTTIQKDPDLVICVARIEGLKNQLTLIRAVKNTRYRLLLIGAPAPNQLFYYRTCRREAGANVKFLGHLPQEELVDYYRKAKVHVLPSWFETTGLSSLEAAAMGCSIVVSDKGDTREYFGDYALYCSPASAQSILTAIKKAADLPANDAFQQKIHRHYTWQQASRHTAAGYRQIIHLT